MLADRLKALRKEKKITQKMLAESLGLKTSTIGSYEISDREPNNEILEKIADFFDTSVDYLLGRSDDRYSISNTNKDIKIELDKLQEMLESQQALMFDGEPIDDTTKILLLEAIKSNFAIHQKLKAEREGKK